MGSQREVESRGQVGTEFCDGHPAGMKASAGSFVSAGLERGPNGNVFVLPA